MIYTLYCECNWSSELRIIKILLYRQARMARGKQLKYGGRDLYPKSVGHEREYQLLEPVVVSEFV